MANLSLQSISAFLILDSNDGQRLLAKYYDASIRPATAAAQRTFETSLHQKVRSSTTAAGPSSTAGAGAASGQTDILLLNPSTLMLYRTSLDLTFVLLAPTNENELLANAVLNAIVDAASILLHHQLEKRALLDSLDLVLLALDETIDDGVVLETDPTAIAARVSRPKQSDDPVPSPLAAVGINEAGLFRAFDVLRSKVRENL